MHIARFRRLCKIHTQAIHVSPLHVLHVPTRLPLHGKISEPESTMEDVPILISESEYKGHVFPGDTMQHYAGVDITFLLYGFC